MLRYKHRRKENATLADRKSSWNKNFVVGVQTNIKRVLCFLNDAHCPFSLDENTKSCSRCAIVECVMMQIKKTAGLLKRLECGAKNKIERWQVVVIAISFNDEGLFFPRKSERGQVSEFDPWRPS